MGTGVGWEPHLPYIVHAMGYGRELSVLRKKQISKTDLEHIAF